MFKINGKQFLLTYPQCPLSKERLLETLQQLADIKTYTCAEEKHQDGSPHLHASVSFQNKIHTTNPRYFDMGNYHANVKVLKTVSDYKRATDYVQKDKEFITNVTKKSSALELLGKTLLEEGLTPQVVRDNPLLLFKNYSSIRSWLSFCVPFKSVPLSTEKRRHVWLHGPSNTGKTTWLRAVKSLFVSAEIPENNDFSHLFKDVEILFVDEYKGFLTIQQLNRIADGDTILNTKGGSVRIGQLTLLILSNFSISDCYKNSCDLLLDTLRNRFVEYDSSISLPRLPVYKL